MVQAFLVIKVRKQNNKTIIIIKVRKQGWLSTPELQLNHDASTGAVMIGEKAHLGTKQL